MKSFQNDVTMIFRGLKEIQFICSGLLILNLIKSIFLALSPFVNIFMSALIINGIAEKKSTQAFIIPCVYNSCDEFVYCYIIVNFESHNKYQTVGV